MGSMAAGTLPFTHWILDRVSIAGVESSTLCLFLASILWTMIYDTIYAHQDVIDDKGGDQEPGRAFWRQH